MDRNLSLSLSKDQHFLLIINHIIITCVYNKLKLIFPIQDNKTSDIIDNLFLFRFM